MNDHLLQPVSRRAFLAGTLAAAVLAPPARAARQAANAPARIVSLDYGLTATLIEVGHPPLAVVSTQDWDKWVVEPPLPDTVVNLGSVREPNLEVLAQLAPDIILSTPYLEGIRPRLEQIAPVESLPVHATGDPPYPHIVTATRRLGDLLGRRNEAEALITRAEQTFVEVRAQVAPLRGVSFYFVNFTDPRHVRVYGAHSLFQDVLDRIGLANAWQGDTNVWGFATIGVEALATDEDAWLFYLEPMPPDALPTLARSPLWRNLPFVRRNRVASFPTVLMFGMIPSAERFARLLAAEADDFRG